MKQLIWKELREQRFIPIAMGVMMIVGLAVWYASSAWLAAHNQGTLLKFDETGIALIIGLYLPGLFAGSGAIAPETGSGTIQFLSTLPTGRRRIWGAKVIAGVTTSCVSMLAVLVGYWIAVTFLYGFSSLFHDIRYTMVRPTQDEAQLLGTTVFFCLYGYSVCLFVSTIVDRTVVAISVGLICALLCYVCFGQYLAMLNVPTKHSWDGVYLVIGLTIALTVAFLAGSMAAFSGQWAGRSKRAWGALLVGFVVVGLGLTLMASVAKRAFAEDQALHVVTMGPDSISPTGGFFWDSVHIPVVFPAKGVRAASCYYRLAGPGPFRPGQFEPVIRRNEHVSLPYLAPASTKDSSPYVASHITNDNRVAITLMRYPNPPGVFHDSVEVLAADGFRSLPI